MNFPESLFETLIVANLPVVLLLQHLHAVQSVNQNLTCLKQCVLQYLVVDLRRYLGLLCFFYLYVTTVLVSFARWEFFIFIRCESLAQSFLAKIFASWITCWSKLNGLAESIRLVLVLLRCKIGCSLSSLCLLFSLSCLFSCNQHLLLFSFLVFVVLVATKQLILVHFWQEAGARPDFFADPDDFICCHYDVRRLFRSRLSKHVLVSVFLSQASKRVAQFIPKFIDASIRLGKFILKLLILTDNACQFCVPCNDQFHLLKSVGKLIVLLDVVLEDLLNLEPLLFFLLHEELFPFEFLLQLFDLCV